MPIRTGSVMDGVQSTTENETEVRANAVTVSKADSSGMTGYIDATNTFIFRNPSVIASGITVTVASNENVVIGGPLQVDGTLDIQGTAIII